jgi:thioredoxin 1
MLPAYRTDPPTRAAIDALQGDTVLEFGTNWCGICQAAAPHVEAALAGRAGLQHLRIEDGPGQPLGRSFGIKLWPTLVLLRAGREVARVVRPRAAADVARLLDAAAPLPADRAP